LRISNARRARAGAAALVLLPAFAFAGCGTADQSDLQNKIKTALQSELSGSNSPAPGATVDSVSCPGNVQLKKGTTFNCTVTVTFQGQSKTLTWEGQIVNNNNDFSGHFVGSGSTPATPSTPNTTTT
jgi:hypothetical protein